MDVLGKFIVLGVTNDKVFAILFDSGDEPFDDSKWWGRVQLL